MLGLKKESDAPAKRKRPLKEHLNDWRADLLAKSNTPKHAAVIVNDDQLSLAIGRSGQNSRLAVQLTGWGLDIITDAEHQVRRALVEESQEELRRLEGVSELIALSLATSGFISKRPPTASATSRQK